MLPIIADEVYEYAVSALQTLKEKKINQKTKTNQRKTKEEKKPEIMCNFSHLVHVHFGIN